MKAPLSRPLFANHVMEREGVFGNLLHPQEEGLRILTIMGSSWCEAVYRGMREADFSKEILQRETEDLRVLPMENVIWCDWGRPDRVADSLRKIGASPSSLFQSLNQI